MISSTDPIVFKVLLLGNSYSGKTTLFDRLNNKNFSSTLESFQMSMLTNIISNNYLFKFHLWDINGYPTIHQIRSFFYIGARSAIVLYDVSDTSGQSYNDVKKWIYELWQKNTLGPVPVLIVGNKIDLRANIPTLSLVDCTKIAQDLIEETGVSIQQIEISAKTGENCDKIFDILTKQFIENYPEMFSE